MPDLLVVIILICLDAEMNYFVEQNSVSMFYNTIAAAGMLSHCMENRYLCI